MQHQFKANCESQKNSLAIYRDSLISCSQKAEIVEYQTSGLNYKDRRILVFTRIELNWIESTLEAEEKREGQPGRENLLEAVSERKEKSK